MGSDLIFVLAFKMTFDLANILQWPMPTILNTISYGWDYIASIISIVMS